MQLLPEPHDVLFSSPCFTPLAELIARLPRGRFPTHAELNGLSPGSAIRFIAPPDDGAHYERRIHATGEVVTRPDNWHDLFNALVWQAFPQTKSALNLLHVRELDGAAEPSSQGRGRVRDAATLFDESGVIVACAEESLAVLLRDFEWRKLFCENRARVQEKMGFFLFGHAQYEKALAPYVGWTGKAWIATVPETFFHLSNREQVAVLDGQVASDLAAGLLADPSALTPLPLLGIPGWAAENADPAYYDNAAYFRSGRGNLP